VVTTQPGWPGDRGANLQDGEIPQYAVVCPGVYIERLHTAL